LFVSSSPHRDKGNTADMIRWVAEELAREGVVAEVVYVGGASAVYGCTGCGGCKGQLRCVKGNDPINDAFARMITADAIVLASPVHFSGVNPELKAIIDRCGMMARLNGNTLTRKVGAAIVAARRAGSVATLDQINHFFGISGMVTVGSTYWNLGLSGRSLHGVKESDPEAQDTMRALGQNIAWLLKCIHPTRPAAAL
jgi:multimeric flavodoxin WrbA